MKDEIWHAEQTAQITDMDKAIHRIHQLEVMAIRDSEKIQSLECQVENLFRMAANNQNMIRDLIRDKIISETKAD